MGGRLELQDVAAGYGRIQVLHGVDLVVPRGAVVALLGANGAGKTTTLRTIAGALAPSRGRILLDGARIDGRAANEVARAGVTLVPEGRGIFRGLTVADNLEIGARAARRSTAAQRSERLTAVHDAFPRLRERHGQKAGTLSGGEQQMLALSRAFLADPQVLLMDEISMGLAPIIVASLFDSIAALRASGLTIVLVEQFLTYALRLADICYVMAKGRIVFVGEPSELRSGLPLAGYLGAVGA
jgi:branched-chain amino acid transport system ATP-binding protein